MISKWINKLKRQFSKEIKMTKYLKRCSKCLVNKEVQNNTAFKFPSHPSQNGYDILKK